ncbi:hypothetical protein [Streptomyces sioyaensis]|uniref:hypothetical protein n=1 Tax=Streptomyces sioyaensis TaxID=67364 RepID=UPI0036E2CAC4
MTCDSENCLAVYLEPDSLPEGVPFEDAITDAGWVSRPAVLADAPDEPGVLGHLCPTCAAGRMPVIERGECLVCMPGGETRHYCRTVTPHSASSTLA